MFSDEGTKPSAEFLLADKVVCCRVNRQLGKVLNIADSSLEVA